MAGEIDATIHIAGLAAFRRDLKKISPLAEQVLRGELEEIAADIAAEAESRVGAVSFSYQGRATAGARASVRSTGRKGFVARFIEFGFHPGGGQTYVPGRNEVGRVLEREHDRIVEEIGDAIMDAALATGWS
jgi:hypothetical protein